MRKCLVGCIVAVLLAGGSQAGSPTPFKALARMPVRLEPSTPLDLRYNWNYYWR